MKNLQMLLEKLAEKIFLGGEGKNQFTSVENGDTRIEVSYTWLDEDYIDFESFDIINYLEKEEIIVEQASSEVEAQVINLVNEMAA